MDQLFSFLDKLAMNQGPALLVGAVVTALLLICISVSVISGRLSARGVVDGICDPIALAAVVGLLGFGLSKIGAEGVAGKILFYLAVALAAAAAVVRYVVGKKKLVREVTSTALRKSAASSAANRFAFSRLYGAALCFVIVAARLAIKGGQCFCHPLFIAALVVAAVLLHKLARLRSWYWIAFIAIVLFVFIISKIYFIEAMAVNMPYAAAFAAVLATLLASLTTLSITKE